MSTLETNSIGKYSGNNVSVDDALNLKSYTTTQRDALTSAAGDMIYNTTEGKPQFYNGSSWVDLGSTSFNTDYLIVAGGGGGGGNSGSYGLGGDGGGGRGGTNITNSAVAGSPNTGGGGGGSANNINAAAAGGSGVVILRYPNTFSIFVGAGLSWSGVEGTVGTDKYITFTGGTGEVSWT